MTPNRQNMLRRTALRWILSIGLAVGGMAVAGPSKAHEVAGPVDIKVAVLPQSVMPQTMLSGGTHPALRTVQPQPVLFGKRKRRKTSVCGDIDIQGEAAGAIAGHLNGCGASDAVRVQSVAGVGLSQQSLMTCETAKALKTWVERDVIKAFGRRDKVVSLRVAAHYACRTRNNRPGAKLSEHGRAKAIDISGFVLESGRVITVSEGWGARKTRKAMRRIWKKACGPFGTVLGPNADRYHQDHFHLDVARHRGGPYCR
ncbi:extensin family protein [Phaeobacter sp.]|uniref:extensin-like domain-containing protein n=1 Tax=Phaeobacter sp. TaxID=1902409 RepID=UPI0025F4802A|nr:extensin family protein [Phaeobacter sp.]